MTTSPQARLTENACKNDSRMLRARQFFAADPFICIKGLDIQEAPGIDNRNHTILNTGHIVTVEPALHYLLRAE
jgi:hypothetical protein